MIVHAWIFGKIVLIGALVLAVLLGLAGGVYLCFAVSSTLGWAVVLALVVGVPAGAYLTVRHLSKTGVLQRLQLLRSRVSAGEGTPAARDEQKLLGMTAVAETPLHLSGAVRVEHKRVIATAEAGFIDKGATVRIIKAAGMNVVVREVEKQQG